MFLDGTWKDTMVSKFSKIFTQTADEWNRLRIMFNVGL
jgi:hypothetical protein